LRNPANEPFLEFNEDPGDNDSGPAANQKTSPAVQLIITMTLTAASHMRCMLGKILHCMTSVSRH